MMKTLILLSTIFLSLSLSADIGQGNLFLRSSNGININFEYMTSEFTPYDWKWSALKMVASYDITLYDGSLKATDKVRAVLINTCKNDQSSYYCKNKTIEIDLEWDNDLEAFIYSKPMGTYMDDDALWLNICCYWNAIYDLEIAIVINDKWLVDPINKTSNFLLIFN